MGPGGRPDGRTRTFNAVAVECRLPTLCPVSSIPWCEQKEEPAVAVATKSQLGVAPPAPAHVGPRPRATKQVLEMDGCIVSWLATRYGSSSLPTMIPPFILTRKVDPVSNQKPETHVGCDQARKKLGKDREDEGDLLEAFRPESEKKAKQPEVSPSHFERIFVALAAWD